MTLLIAPLTTLPRPVAAQGPPSIQYLLGGHSNSVNSFAMSPDGNYYASASSDGTAKLWRTADNSLVRTFANGYAVTAVGFTADSATLITGDSNGRLIEWNVADASLKIPIIYTYYIDCLAVSADGKYVAVGANGSGYNDVRVYNVASGAQVATLQGHSDYISSLAFSPRSSNVLVSASNDGTARIWNVASQQTTFILNPGGGSVHQAAISPDGKTIATAGEQYPMLWSMATGKLINTLKDPNSNTHFGSVAFSPDGSTLAVQQYFNYIALWNLSTGTITSLFGGRGGPVAYFNDGNSLAQIAGWNLLRYSTPAGSLIGSIDVFVNFPGVQSVAFTPDGQTLGADANAFFLFNAATGAPAATPAGGGGTLVFSPDGKTAVTGNINEFGIPGAVFEHGLQYSAWTIGFTPDSSAFVSFSGDNVIRTTRTSDGTQLSAYGTAGGANGAGVSPDGSVVAVGYNNSVNVYSASGTLLNTLTDPSIGMGFVQGLLWSSGAQYLLTTGTDDNIRIWTNAQGSAPTLKYVIPYNNARVISAAFSPYNDTFTVGRSDLSVTEYRVLDGAVLAEYNAETGMGVISIAYSPNAATQAWGRADSTVVVVNNEFANALASVTLTPSVVQGGQTVQGTVSLNTPAPTAITIALSSNSGAAKVQTNVSIPQGQQSATFLVTTSAVSADTTATLSASYNGVTRSANLTVQPAIALKAVTVVPGVVSGGQDAVGVVTLTTAAPAGGITIPLSAGSSPVVALPPSVTVAAGNHSAQFLIGTAAVTANQKVPITATSGGVTRSFSLTVAPATIASVTLAPSTVSSGENAFGLVTLSAPAATDVTVTIASASPSIAQTDTTLVIPAGSMQGAFNLATTQGSVTKSTPVKITVTAYGASKAATLTVTP
jgi:WD40 repeat protein